MFDENEKLRQELIQTKMYMEQHQNSHQGTIKKQPSTIVLTNLTTNDQTDHSNENQQLRNEIILLKNQLTEALNKEHKSNEDDSLRSLDQRRIKDLERQVKELGTSYEFIEFDQSLIFFSRINQSSSSTKLHNSSRKSPKSIRRSKSIRNKIKQNRRSIT
jgi:hypothetical protein